MMERGGTAQGCSASWGGKPSREGVDVSGEPIPRIAAALRRTCLKGNLFFPRKG